MYPAAASHSQGVSHSQPFFTDVTHQPNALDANLLSLPNSIPYHPHHNNNNTLFDFLLFVETHLVYTHIHNGQVCHEEGQEGEEGQEVQEGNAAFCEKCAQPTNQLI